MDVCKELRQKKIQTPIIMFTARDAVQDRVQGLDAGADDYITKPFDFDELLARIRSVLRRKRTTELPQLKIGNLVLNPVAHEVKRAGRLISLCRKEYGLLGYLMRNPNKVVSRCELFKHVWGPNLQAKSNIVDVYIRYLRKKVDTEHVNKLICTVRGTGYKIKG